MFSRVHKTPTIILSYLQKLEKIQLTYLNRRFRRRLTKKKIYSILNPIFSKLKNNLHQSDKNQALNQKKMVSSYPENQQLRLTLHQKRKLLLTMTSSSLSSNLKGHTLKQKLSKSSWRSLYWRMFVLYLFFLLQIFFTGRKAINRQKPTSNNQCSTRNNI